MAKPVSAWKDDEVLSALKEARSHKPLVVEERAHKAYKLMLKTEAARRNILPVGDDGEDQNFKLPEAEIIALRTGFGGITSQEQSDPYVGAARPGGGGALEADVVARRAIG